MKQQQIGKADNICDCSGNQGFTFLELLMILVAIILLVVFLLPLLPVRERSRRLECLSNQNGLWKAASQWGLSPKEWWIPRPLFPETNLSYALAVDNAGVSPELFICPGAAKKNYRSWGIAPVTNLNAIRANNCNYAYFGRHTNDADSLILIADKNGSNNLPSASAWGGNHDGKGGNVIKVAGQGFWVASTAECRDDLYCITNADVAAAFTNTGLVYSY